MFKHFFHILKVKEKLDSDTFLLLNVIQKYVYLFHGLNMYSFIFSFNEDIKSKNDLFVQCCCHRCRKGKAQISVGDNLNILVIWIRAFLTFSVAVQWLKADKYPVAPSGL